MYIRRKVFSLLTVEGEEKLFSTIDINLEDTKERLFSINEDAQEVELEQKEFSKEEEDSKKEKTGKKLKTAGKVAMAAGGTAALAGGIGENIVVDKIAKKAAGKYGVEKVGKGLASTFIGLVPDASKAVKVSERAAKNSKVFRRLVKADKIGSGVALAGLGAYTAGKIMSKKKKDNKKEK